MQPLKSLQLVFTNKDLRKRILITICIILIFRVLAQIPLPGVDISGLKAFFENNQLFGLLDLFSGGSVSRFSLVLLGVGPYITASIAFQLLVMVIPSLEALQKEGEYGRKKINQYTRYASVPLAFIEAYGLLRLLQSQGVIQVAGVWELVLILIAATAGSVFLMWLGEIISEKGIGNGISMIIAFGIIAGLPPNIGNLAQIVSGDSSKILLAIVYGLVIIAMIVFIVWMTEAERRIPVTYATRMRSMRDPSRIESYLPIKLNAAGVIPIIFATSLLVFPGVVSQLFTNARSEWLRTVAHQIQAFFSNNYYYAIVFFVLVIAFTYFYTSVIFKPDQVAENLQKQGSFVPGVRPGHETSRYIRTILYRVTTTGALFLAAVAVVPFLLQATTTEFKTLAIGGTGILIIVAVAIDTMNQIKSQMVSQTYDKYL